MPNCHGSVLVGQRDVNIRLCVRRRWCCALSLTLFKHLAAVPRLMHCHLYFLLGLFIQPSKFSFLLSGSSACACSSDLWLRMVQIINGDIVQDNDPRLQQRSNRPHAAPARAPAGAGPPTRSRGGPPPAPVAGFTLAGFDSGLDFSAPAVKLVARPDAPGGIPDVELFALRVPGVGLLGVAAAGAFFGLKGLLAAAVLGYLYLRTGGGGGQPAPAAGRGTAAAGQSSGGFFMQQQQQQQEGFSASPQQQPAPGGQSSAFKGKAYKLGGS